MHAGPLGDAARYYRPVGDKQTSQTLFVGNVGPAVGVSALALQHVCLEFGEVDVDIPDAAKSFAFLTFSSTEAATRAKSSLSTGPCFGRQLQVKFARLSQKYRVRCSS